MTRLALFTAIVSISATTFPHPAIILFGAPGSGKGTFAELLVHDYGYAHWALGDVLRGHLQKKTEIGKQLLPLRARK